MQGLELAFFLFEAYIALELAKRKKGRDASSGRLDARSASGRPAFQKTLCSFVPIRKPDSKITVI